MPDGLFSHRNASNALFECFRGKIKDATENGIFFMKNGYTKKFFSGLKSADLT